MSATTQTAGANQGTKRKAAQVVPSHVHPARNLLVTAKDIHIGLPEILEKHKNKIVALQPADGDSVNRVNIIIDGGGYIPSFGVDVNKQYGATYLVFPVNHKAEQAGLAALDKRIFDLGCTDAFWPERPVKNGRKAPVESVVEESYLSIMKKSKEKKTGGGMHAPMVKVGVPIQSSTGDVAKTVKIVDHKGDPVSIHSLAGRKFQRIVFELHYIYFKAPAEFGVVKRLKYVKLADDGGGSGDPGVFDELNYLDEEDPEQKVVGTTDTSEPAASAVEPAAPTVEAAKTGSLDDALLEELIATTPAKKHKK